MPERVPALTFEKDANAGDPDKIEYWSGVPVEEVKGILKLVALVNIFPMEPMATVGNELTVMTAVAELVQELFTLLATVYVIVDEPAATPWTIPVDELIVAIPVALLAQVPPVVVLDKVLLAPIHVDKVPVMVGVAGGVVTVTDVTVDVAWHPVVLFLTVTVYDPVVVEVILWVVAPVLHVYEKLPAGADSVTDPPVQNDVEPDAVIVVLGNAFTVELGKTIDKSEVAPEEVIDKVPEFKPTTAEALNLKYNVVVETVPELVCETTKEVAYVPVLVADISNPVGAVRLTVLVEFKPVAAIVKLWAVDAVPKQELKAVKLDVLVNVPLPPA